MTKKEKERIEGLTNAELRLMERHGLFELSDKYRKEIEREFKNRIIRQINSDENIVRDLLFKQPERDYFGTESRPTDYFLKLIKGIDLSGVYDTIREELYETIERHKDDIVKNTIKDVFINGLADSLFSSTEFKDRLRNAINND